MKNKMLVEMCNVYLNTSHAHSQSNKRA